MKKLFISTVAMMMISSCQPKDEKIDGVSEETVFEKVTVELKPGDGFEILEGERTKFYPPNNDVHAHSNLRILDYAYLGRISVTDIDKKDIAFQYIGIQITEAYGVEFTKVFNGPESASFQPNYIILMAGRDGVINLIFTDTEEEGQYDVLMTVAAH